MPAKAGNVTGEDFVNSFINDEHEDHIREIKIDSNSQHSTSFSVSLSVKIGTIRNILTS